MDAPQKEKDKHPEVKDGNSPSAPQERQFEVTASRFEGPLPPPHILAQYDDIDPNLVNRIVTMAEKQQNHRHEMEAKEQKYLYRTYGLGKVLGGFIACFAVAAATFLLYNDKNIAGFAIFITALATLIGSFLYGKKEEKKYEESAKQEQSETE